MLIVEDENKYKNGIYKITDIKTGRFYIGSACSGFSKRLGHHIYRLNRGDHPNRTMQAIFNKDHERLSFSILEVISGEHKDVLNSEQFHIDHEIKNFHRRMLINELLVVGSHIGKKRTKETCMKISIALTGKALSEETKNKIRNAKIGKKLSESHCKKLSELRRGKKINRPYGIPIIANRKFTDDQVREFRNLKAQGLSYSEIRKIHKVSHGGLQKIINRLTYSEVI